MIALIVEFSCIVGLFVWLHRRQVRDRDRHRRLPRRQMRLGFEDEDEG